MSEPGRLFFEVRRGRRIPFWEEPQLVLRPRFWITIDKTSTINEDESDTDNDEPEGLEKEEGEELDDEESVDVGIEDPNEHSRKIQSSLDKIKELVRE